MFSESNNYHSLSKIVLLSYNSSDWSAEDDKLLQFLSEERRTRVLKYVHIKDRKASLYAAILAKHELGQLVGDNLHFSFTEYGKPFLTEHPEICFNISHTHGSIIFAYTKSTETPNEIGVDIEIIKKAPLSVMNSTFHKNECEFVNEDTNNITNRFYTIWTRKEALFKAKGTGLTDKTLRNTDTTKYHSLSSPSIWSSNYESAGDSYVFSIASKYPLANHQVDHISSHDLALQFLNNQI